MESVKINSGIGSAVFSPDGRHRYRLDRILDEGLQEEQSVPTLLWVMLNPSVAGASEPDPTVTKCMGFARRWGYRRLTVVNLFTVITAYPKELAGIDDRIGPAAEQHIVEAAGEAGLIICAWGKPPDPTLGARTGRVLFLLREGGQKPPRMACLGRTQEGHPRHPGRLAYKTKREVFFK